MPRFQILLLLDLCPPRHLKQAGTAPTPQPRTNKRQVFPHRPSVFRRNAAVCSTPETQSWLFIIAMISLETVRSIQASPFLRQHSSPSSREQRKPKSDECVRSDECARCETRKSDMRCLDLVRIWQFRQRPKARVGLPRRSAVGLPHGVFPTHSTPPCP